MNTSILITPKTDLFNAGLCFKKGNNYTVTKPITQLSSLMDCVVLNEMGEPHTIGSWWREFIFVQEGEEEEAEEIEQIEVSNLSANFRQFGNKGSVWGNQTHIENGGANTLCGTPMLSNNWANIWSHKSIGCPSCIAEYKRLTDEA